MRTGTPKELIVFLINANQDKVYDVKEHKDRRSLTQNAYYWALLTKVADKLHRSKPEVHNLMMRQYGRDFEIAGERIGRFFPDTDETEEAMLRSETFHFRPTGKTKTDEQGAVWRGWYLLKSSHEMTTDEMSVLVDGLVQEARQQDIETLTPRELEELRQYELQRGKSKGDGHTTVGQTQSLGA